MMNEMRRNKVLDNFIDAVKTMIAEETSSSYIITSSRSNINNVVTFYVYEKEIIEDNKVAIVSIILHDEDLEDPRCSKPLRYAKWRILSEIGINHLY